MSGELRRRAEAFLHTGEDYHRARPTPHEQERRIARRRELLRERPTGPLVERYETIAWRFTLPGA